MLLCLPQQHSGRNMCPMVVKQCNIFHTKAPAVVAAVCVQALALALKAISHSGDGA